MNEISENRLKEKGSIDSLKFKILLDIIDFDKIRDGILEEIRQQALSGKKIDDKTDISYMIRSNNRLSVKDIREIVIDQIFIKLQNIVMIYGNHLYIKTDHGWQKYEKLNNNKINSKFGAFLSDCLGRDIMPIEDTDKIMKHVYNRISIEFENNGIIQFNDYYIKNSEFYEGFYLESIPQYIINKNIKNTIEANVEPTIHPVLKDFLLHLSNGDEIVMHHLLNRISLVFLLKNEHRNLRKFIRLYGPTAENGKSTFLNLLTRTIENDNVTSMSTSEVKGYTLGKVACSLLAMDADSSSNYLTPTVAENIKNIVFGDMIEIRNIYQDPIDIIPNTLLIAASNSMPKSGDKTEGLNRRLEWYKIKGKLKRDNSWFRTLESDTIAQNLLDILIYKAKHIDEYDFYQTPKALEEINNEFKYNNNNVLKFIDEFSEEEIVNHTVKHVRYLYDEWCQLNGEIEFKDTHFTNTLISELDLKKKRLLVKNIADNDKHYKINNKDPQTSASMKLYCWVKNE